jgi:hypothetical protein
MQAMNTIGSTGLDWKKFKAQNPRFSLEIKANGSLFDFHSANTH